MTPQTPAAGFLIGPRQTLVCLGDSITENPSGYCAMLAALIAAAYPERAIRVINAGVSGNKIGDMFARVERDVLAHQPNWVTLSVGINDVWHGMVPEWAPGTPLSQFGAGAGMLVERLVSAGARVLLLPPTVIGEEPHSEGNRRLAPYRIALREVALNYAPDHVLVAPTDRDFDIALAAGKSADPTYSLTTDGVHLRPAGDAVVALAVLRTLRFFDLLVDAEEEERDAG